MALATMQKGNLDEIEPDVHGRIAKASAVLEGVTVTRVTFGPGARWSEDLKDYAGTETCELPHVALVMRGRLHVRMDDGKGGRGSSLGPLARRPRRRSSRRWSLAAAAPSGRNP